MRSHTSITSKLSDEQRSPSNGWKSNDFTTPLCPARSNNTVPGYKGMNAHVTKGKGKYMT